MLPPYFSPIKHYCWGVMRPVITFLCCGSRYKLATCFLSESQFSHMCNRVFSCKTSYWEPCKLNNSK